MAKDHAVEKRQKLVGPVVTDPILAEALAQAIETDNPDAEVYVDDRGGYIRIHTPRICRITRKSLREALGYDMHLSALEPKMCAFAGRMWYVDDEALYFYLEGEVTEEELKAIQEARRDV
ncbi:MAG: MmoB/DmpM family protein [Hydrogenibacillus sp.]|nr:MmoB/DmpM family protein [Hydrogenibacillus sp.]